MNSDEDLAGFIRKEYPERAEEIIQHCQMEIAGRFLDPEGRWSVLNKVLHDNQPRPSTEPRPINSGPIRGRFVSTQRAPAVHD